jgi:acylglycerol lipase
MGHSMGGAEVLHYAILSPSSETTPPIRSQIRGFLAEAPFIALHPSAEPSSFIVFAGRIAGKIFPKRQMLQKLESKWMCRDEAVCKDWEEDELCHDTGTLEGMSGMLDRGAQLDGMQKPVVEGAALWVGHGSEDRVTSCEASKRFVGKADVSKGKELKVYEGCYHKLHAEPGEDKKKFASDVGDWILARSGEEEGARKAKL